MPICFADAARVLLACGYSPFHETSKVQGFALGSRSVYLKKPRNGNAWASRPLVVPADGVADYDKLASLRGVERSKGRSDFYHNANMKAFGRRLNGGAHPTRYGYDFDFDGPSSMVAFLNELK